MCGKCEGDDIKAAYAMGYLLFDPTNLMVCPEGAREMNARTTTLMIVLAIVMAGCMAPMPAPPPRVQMPKVEQTLPIQNAPAQNKLPAVVQVNAPTDAQAKALLEAQQLLTSRLMVGVPWQARPYIETYAAIHVAETTKLPATQPSLDPWAYPDYAMKAMAQYERHQKEKAAYALLRDLTTAQQKPVNVTKESATYALLRDLLADNQDLIYERMSGLPIQVLPYVENYAAVEAARKMLPENVLPAMADSNAHLSMIEHWAVGVPAEVRPAIERYIETLKTPEMTNAEKIKLIEHNAVGTPPEVHSAIQQYVETLQTP
jgi:hypothetical protein